MPHRRETQVKEDGSWVNTRRTLVVLTFDKLTILIFSTAVPARLGSMSWK